MEPEEEWYPLPLHRLDITDSPIQYGVVSETVPTGTGLDSLWERFQSSVLVGTWEDGCTCHCQQSATLDCSQAQGGSDSVNRRHEVDFKSLE